MGLKHDMHTVLWVPFGLKHCEKAELITLELDLTEGISPVSEIPLIMKFTL